MESKRVEEAEILLEEAAVAFVGATVQGRRAAWRQLREAALAYAAAERMDQGLDGPG